MNQTPDMPPHSRVDQLFDSIDLGVSASEMHGVICGLFSAGHADAHAAWFEELFANRSSDDLLVREARQLLGQLYLATQLQLTGTELDFSPLLPSDDSPLQERARSLSQWCQGYLYGLGMAGITEPLLRGDAKEVIGDISEFTRLDYANLEPGEAAEMAYMELVEFLRVATLLIGDELSGKKAVDHDCK